VTGTKVTYSREETTKLMVIGDTGAMITDLARGGRVSVSFFTTFGEEGQGPPRTGTS